MNAAQTIPANYHLPATADELEHGLRGLIDIFGAEEVYVFLKLMFDNTSRRQISDLRAVYAAERVEKRLLENPDEGYFAARRVIAAEMGHRGTDIPNFNRTADRGRDLLMQRGHWKVPADQDRPYAQTPTA